jgi:hypothetical protein
MPTERQRFLAVHRRPQLILLVQPEVQLTPEPVEASKRQQYLLD